MQNRKISPYLAILSLLLGKVAREAWERPFSLFIDPLDSGENARSVQLWRYFLRLVAIVFVVSAASFASGATVQPIKRTIDPITVLGKNVVSLNGKKISRLGLFAFDGEYLKAIPFQIDERKNGDYVYRHGEIASVDTDNGALDADDEIAFMCSDAGLRLQPLLLPEGAIAGTEIEVLDPVDGARGYVYLLAFTGDAPRSRTDYVVYHVARNEIETTDYVVGYGADAPISIQRLAVKPAIGGSGVSVADRQKIRIEGDSFWKLVHLSRNEGDFRTKVLGYIDGPVRVIRSTKNWQVIFWEIPTPSVRLASTYWKTGMVFPMKVEIPFSITKLFKKVSMKIYVDTPPTVPGRRYYNNHNPQGVDIDGRMSTAERAMNQEPFEWQVVAGTTASHPEGWFSRHIYSMGELPIRLPLYYVDDIHQPDPPERYPGCYGCLGFEFEGIEKLDAGNFGITIQMFPVLFYKPGDQRRLLDIKDRPLQTKVLDIPRN